jgi:RTX calcium-binding nonapeptide repeat (4 copies)
MRFLIEAQDAASKRRVRAAFERLVGEYAVNEPATALTTSLLHPALCGRGRNPAEHACKRRGPGDLPCRAKRGRRAPALPPILEDVDEDIETIQGSDFADTLFDSGADNLLRGLNGNDTIGGGAGADVIDEGSAANGADFLNGGDGPNDRVTYGARTSGVIVSLEPDCARRWTIRVPPDPYLRADSNDYSLDPRLVGRRVEVIVDQREVTVALDTGELACRRRRVFARHRTLTALEHASAVKAGRRERRDTGTGRRRCAPGSRCGVEWAGRLAIAG